jgi:hypothetical protein
MDEDAGLEPAFLVSETNVLPLDESSIVERDTGFEPVMRGWKPLALPLG